MKTEQKHTFRIIGTPSRTGASHQGYISLLIDENEEIYVPVSDITDIRSGQAVTDEAISEYGIRAQGVNCSVVINEDRHFLQTNLPALRRAFHLVNQGYSIDATNLMRSPKFNAPFPSPYEIGTHCEGKGIFVGVYEANKRLKRIFNVFAAPTDFRTPSQSRFTHKEAVAALINEHDFHGYPGSPSPQNKASEKTGDKLSDWHLPQEALFNDSDFGLASLLKEAEHDSDTKYMTNYKDYDDWVYYYAPYYNSTSHTSKDKTSMRVRPVRMEPYDTSLLFPPKRAKL